ncbi:MAG: efflux RND transporter periplasmic adaptor subunit [Acidobacteria bacterium]|nr:efflux RND transporter periplasmic adaptor subunit [Acidobacteriota bacterium]
MTRTKKIAIAIGVVAVVGTLGFVNYRYRRNTAPSVTTEKVARRDLEAIVSASGKIRAKKTVNISAETMGKIVTLAVTEGERVKKGQLLLEIDPRNLETAVQNRQASLDSARSQLEQTRAQVESARVALKQAQENYQRQTDLWRAGLVARDVYERTQNELKAREADLAVSEQAVRTQEQRIRVEEANLTSARYDLNKVRVESPIDGVVIKRNVEEGETAVVGTMNNAGTVLLQIADMSVIEAEIEVDETDIPFVNVGQPAQIQIDAFPDQKVRGRVTEVGNSPITTTGTSSTTGRATNFKVVVQVEGPVPDVRPGFTCTSVITTATRARALGVPIQAMTIREFIVDAEGQVVKPPAAAANGSGSPPPVQEPGPGQERKELEGVFVYRQDKAVFVPVRTGIAGEKYFEVLSGLNEGDEVITGPFASVRSLKDGDALQRAKADASTGAAATTP